MLFGCVLGDEQHEELPDRLAVGRVERYRSCQSNECAGRLAESFDAAVRNRDALTQARGAQLLACGEACRNDRAREPRASLEQRAGLLEEPCLRIGVDVERDVRSRQQLGDRVQLAGALPSARSASVSQR